MKTLLLDISKNMAYDSALDTGISFRPFLRHLHTTAGEKKGLKGRLYQQVLSEFESQLQPEAEIFENFPKHEKLFELIYTSLTPFISDDINLAWGLSFPLCPRIVYGTDSLYAHFLKSDGSINTEFFSNTKESYQQESLQNIYSLVLERLYGFHAPFKKEKYCCLVDSETGTEKYYQFHIDNQFVDVTGPEVLPEVDLKLIYNRLNEGCTYQILPDLLPLHLFKFRGISIVKVTDVTRQHALEGIKNSWAMHTPDTEIQNYHTLLRHLKNLVQDKQIAFDLFPFYRVNGKMVYTYEKGSFSLLTAVWGEKRLSPDRFHAEADGYASNPMFFYSENINQEKDERKMLYLFRKYNVCSLALKPVFLNRQPLGVLGIYTQGEHTFNETTLSLLEEAIPYLAQLLQVYIHEFNLEIENIIKEKFTSVQKSVQWKFNEVAWKFLYNTKKQQTPAEIETVRFEKVSPLYGAVDIRNSTFERNKAVKADLISHLRLVSDTLKELEQQSRWPILEELALKCITWLKMVDSDRDIMSNEETNLNHFLNFEISSVLMNLAQQETKIRPAIDAYIRAIDEDSGTVLHHKKDYERSVQMITGSIGHYLESEKREIQKFFPCYFEKFKTDGVEYDIYIGKSIAPEKPYTALHLKNLRVWQLKTMATMARITHTLLPEMPLPLHTTQLIFAHGKTIDISFRNDERRFDVEGDYNIRYQMIKKRIDKVHVKINNERLTQPGKIALVYLNRADVADYREHIRFLQEAQVLKGELEEFELEELQGISGLKALRVAVNLD